jgi:N-acetylmuramoyl-L-alanine amidase
MGKRNETNVVVVHCSATRPDSKVTFDDIRRWHMMERAFMDIGYHFVIERDGSLKQGRAIDDWGAHVKGHNHESVGICLVGGMDARGQAEDNFTPLQKQMLRFLVAGCRGLWPGVTVKGHHHYNRDKDCPSFDVQAWLVDEGMAP